MFLCYNLVMEYVIVGLICFVSGAHLGAAFFAARLHKIVTGESLTEEKWFEILKALLQKAPNRLNH